MSLVLQGSQIRPVYLLAAKEASPLALYGSGLTGGSQGLLGWLGFRSGLWRERFEVGVSDDTMSEEGAGTLEELSRWPEELCRRELPSVLPRLLISSVTYLRAGPRAWRRPGCLSEASAEMAATEGPRSQGFCSGAHRPVRLWPRAALSPSLCALVGFCACLTCRSA